MPNEDPLQGKQPYVYRALSHGRGGFRTCDLSRVKRDDNDGETGNSKALYWGVARV
jgi:hypothetical protein